MVLGDLLGGLTAVKGAVRIVVLVIPHRDYFLVRWHLNEVRMRWSRSCEDAELHGPDDAWPALYG